MKNLLLQQNITPILRTAVSDGSNNQLGPKASSYEEAVEGNDSLGNSQTSTQVVPSGSKESLIWKIRLLHLRLRKNVMKMPRQLHNSLNSSYKLTLNKDLLLGNEECTSQD